MIGAATGTRWLELRLRCNDVQLLASRPMKIWASVIPFWNDDGSRERLKHCNERRGGLQFFALGWLIPPVLKCLLSFPESAPWRIVMVLPEIRLLQAAIVLAEELHFSRAADRLNMSQSTLSKQIFKLERGLGFQVFKHSHQVAELTEAGRVFIVEAREVVSMRNGRSCRLGQFSMGRMKFSISASRPIPNRFSFQRFYPPVSPSFPR